VGVKATIWKFAKHGRRSSRAVGRRELQRACSLVLFPFTMSIEFATVGHEFIEPAGHFSRDKIARCPCTTALPLCLDVILSAQPKKGDPSGNTRDSSRNSLVNFSNSGILERASSRVKLWNRANFTEQSLKCRYVVLHRARSWFLASLLVENITRTCILLILPISITYRSSESFVFERKKERGEKGRNRE